MFRPDLHAYIVSLAQEVLRTPYNYPPGILIDPQNDPWLGVTPDPRDPSGVWSSRGHSWILVPDPPVSLGNMMDTISRLGKDLYKCSVCHSEILLGPGGAFELAENYYVIRPCPLNIAKHTHDE